MSNLKNKKSLLDFLVENPVDDIKETIVVSKRLKDYPFIVKAMSGDDFSRYQKQATSIDKKQNVSMDNKKFNELIVLNHVIDEDGKPYFKVQDNHTKAGVRTSEDFLYKFITAGEIAEFVKKISELSGFDVDEDEVIEEVKND